MPIPDAADAESPSSAPAALAGSAARGSARLRIGVGAAVLLVIAAVAVAVVSGLLAPAARVQDLSAAPPGAGEVRLTARATPSLPATVLVHVLGAVTTAGVYELPRGSRVFDAVAAAGGLSSDADAAGVNLARVLADGEQIVVPLVGQAAPPGASASSPGRDTSGAGANGPLNLNTASQEQLEELPRVGPAMAQRIIAWREANGGFASVDDLLEVTGIGQKTLDGMRDLVTV